MNVGRTRTTSAVALAGLLALASWGWAQGQMGHGKTESAQGSQMEHGKPEAQAPIRTTMEELHQHGGVPPGWKFLMPLGHPGEGRKVFITMECFSCHEIKGEQFPRKGKKPGDVGPELTGMGPNHPAEYFAEKIMKPNRVIIEGPGYTGSDGLSKMPDYAESMTLRQLIDLVAYLRSLTSGGIDHKDQPTGGHGGKIH